MTLAQAIRSPWSAVDDDFRRYDVYDTPNAAQNQNYVADAPVMNSGRLRSQYAYPTRFNGRFAQAMSAVARDPRRGFSGKVTGNNLDDKFQSEVSQALAIKLDLKTRQHANEKVLNQLVHSGGECSSLKQAVQARAAVYGEVGEPS